MSCKHKFSKYLNLENLDFKPTTLIVGTFNPEWPVENSAEWFYGRTKNNYFWEVLPLLYKEKSLIDQKPIRWKAFCKEHKIAITDIISTIEDADEMNESHCKYLRSYSDNMIAKKFKKHVPVNIINLLKKHQSITNVYLTRSTTPAFWKRFLRPVEAYCIEERITFKKLITPSKNARFQAMKYKKSNKDDCLDLQRFVFMKWHKEWR